MPNVSAGTSASVTLSGAQTIEFSLDQNEEAQVIVTRSGVQRYGGSVRSSMTIGPYLSGDVLTITASRGAVDYTLASYSDPQIDAAESAAIHTLVSGAGTYVNANGALYGLAETTPYVTPAPSVGSSAFTGACELAGWFCSVAAGTITIYDALSAVGTPIVPATTLAVGPMPIFGAGTTGKLVMTTGCFVVLSGASTVRVLVG